MRACPIEISLHNKFTNSRTVASHSAAKGYISTSLGGCEQGHESLPRLLPFQGVGGERREAVLSDALRFDCRVVFRHLSPAVDGSAAVCWQAIRRLRLGDGAQVQGHQTQQRRPQERQGECKGIGGGRWRRQGQFTTFSTKSMLAVLGCDPPDLVIAVRLIFCPGSLWRARVQGGAGYQSGAGCEVCVCVFVFVCWPMKHPEASGFRPINVCPRIRTVGGWAATDAQRQRPLEEGKFLGVCVHMVEYLGDARESFFLLS